MTSTTIDHTDVPAPVTRARPGQVLAHSLILAQRQVMQMFRTPEMLVFSAIQPVMFLLLFNYVLGGAIIRDGSYINFLIPGIVVQMVAFTSFGTAMGLNTDLAKGVIDRLRSLPIARSAVLTGRILADTLLIGFNVALLTGVGALFGFRISGGVAAALTGFVLATLFGIAVAWIGALIGLKLRNVEAIQSFGMIWLFPLTFASSAFAPVETMPGWLQAFVRVNPVTLVVDALRALWSGAPAATLVLQSLAWIGGILVVFFTLAVRQYRRIE